MFSEKVIGGNSRSFSSTDLLQYVETLIRESRLQERTASINSNYIWLKSKHIQMQEFTDMDLQDCKPLIYKITPESCASIAVKLDILTETSFLTASDITITFKKLLEETITSQLLRKNVKAKKRGKKVHPELGGRKPTVSFIL